MSSLLYTLGRWAFRRRRLVLVLWLAMLVLLVGGAALFSKGAENAFAIPGTESQEAIDSLSHTFPEVSGASAQFVVVAPGGDTVTDPAIEEAISQAVSVFSRVDGVSSATSPFDENVGAVSDDKTAAIISISLDVDANHVTDQNKAALKEAAAEVNETLPSGVESALGGQIFSTSVVGLSIVELIGLLVALVTLVLTFGSFLAAGMPLITALLGVVISIALIFLSTLFGTISSVTPTLALMLGLAVGIDYSLFIISRHQEQLRAGIPPEESAARATATAGSAVVFAGLTVIIALLGLAVANMPFITTMGVAAAAAVAVAVLLSLTLTPALLGFAGARITPGRRRGLRISRRRNPKSGADAVDLAAGSTMIHGGPGPESKTQSRFFSGWVRAATRSPIVTIAGVVVLLGALALPALSLRLALPDAGALPAEDEARITYELVSDHFGTGYNGPLIVTGSIVGSTDPLGLMADLKSEFEGMDGVAAVPLATPNRNADTGIIQVISTGSPDSDETKALVTEIRDRHDYFLDKYRVDLKVTGFTAIGIDISDRLGGALLPFALVVVGLCLILLTMVFRSIWVPVKATIGYLLSVAASFGVVSLVFQFGVLADPLNVARTGPIISFMPIIVMGVLFGLAMDYEVFLVSRIREDFVHTGKARASVTTGFLGSAKVVTAAAIIMFAVFGAFVPEGDNNIKPLALGLAAGVFVDAFIIRMTFVPAVLALLGDRAWYMPKWLDRILPSFDIEGSGLQREIALRQWRPGAEIAAEGLSLAGPDRRLYENVDLTVAAGDVLLVQGSRPVEVSALLLTLAGRLAADEGRLKVAGLVLPVRAGAVRARVGYVNLADADADRALRRTLAEQPPVVIIDRLDALTEEHALTTVYEAVLIAHRSGQRAGKSLTIAMGTDDATAMNRAFLATNVSVIDLDDARPAGLNGEPATTRSLQATPIESKVNA